MHNESTQNGTSTSAQWVLPFRSINKDDLPRVGGKGANLGEMTQANFPVPGGFCVTTEAFRAFMEGAGNTSELFTKLSSLNPEDTEAVRRAAEEVRAFVRRWPLRSAVRSVVDTAW